VCEQIEIAIHHSLLTNKGETMNEQQPQTTETFVPSEPSEHIDPIELLTAENDRLRSELRLRSARDSLLSAFANENARSPELLFEASAPRFEFDDDGSLANADDLISGLRSRFPEQFESVIAPLPPPGSPPEHLRAGWTEEGWTPKADGVAGVPTENVNTSSVRHAAPPPVPPIHAGAGRDRPHQTLTKEALTQMSPQQILALDWDEVKRVLSS
jgi:hypothetical protein